jgi:hypothetical protein
VPLSRLQERIAELSSSVVATDDIEEFQQIAAELKAALRDQINHLRGMVDDAKKTMNRVPTESAREKNKADGKGA